MPDARLGVPLVDVSGCPPRPRGSQSRLVGCCTRIARAILSRSGSETLVRGTLRRIRVRICALSTFCRLPRSSSKSSRSRTSVCTDARGGGVPRFVEHERHLPEVLPLGQLQQVHPSVFHEAVLLELRAHPARLDDVELGALSPWVMICWPSWKFTSRKAGAILVFRSLLRLCRSGTLRRNSQRFRSFCELDDARTRRKSEMSRPHSTLSFVHRMVAARFAL